MNFLELSQKLRQMCGIPGEGPTTVTGQTKELLRIIEYVSNAWNMIQVERPDWFFLRDDFSFSTIAHQQEYTPTQAGITDFGSWIDNSFTLYSAITDEMYLTQMDYQSFRETYLLGSLTTQYARPQIISISPKKNLLISPNPNDVYTLKGEYYTAPVALVNDSDTPAIPARFHMAIVYLAMMEYGVFEAASEVYERGLNAYNYHYAQLVDDQTESITAAGGFH